MVVEHVAALDALVQKQHGLATGVQAESVLGAYRKRRWVTEGRLVSVQPGVFRVAGAPETWHQALQSVQLATDGVVSHRSAAELWGLLRPRGCVEVSVQPDRRPRIRPPAIVHRIKDLHPELATRREGLILTDPVRTIVDLGLVVSPELVGAALRRAMSQRLVTLVEARHLRDRLGRQGRNGTGVLGEVVDLHVLRGERAESELELRLLDIRRRFDLPMLTVQYEVWSGGRCVARVDAAYPSLKLAIEVDGFEFHSTPEAFQRDRTRQNDLVALGWTVLRFTWKDVTQHPELVAHRIRTSIGRLQAA